VFILTMLGDEKDWERFARAIECADLTADPRFVSMADRHTNSQAPIRTVTRRLLPYPFRLLAENTSPPLGIPLGILSVAALIWAGFRAMRDSVIRLGIGVLGGSCPT
jgi:hypothetical protein